MATKVPPVLFPPGVGFRFNKVLGMAGRLAFEIGAIGQHFALNMMITLS